MLVALVATPAAAQERRVALVVGNGAYAHAARLPNPVNDAEAVATTLRGLGFSVTVARDQTRAAMRRALRDFSDAARGADVALFFFAGHGLQAGQRDRAESFLVPTDARLADERDLEDETIALSRVLALMDGARARLVILDACRDNPLVTRMARAGATRSVSRGLAPIEAAGGSGTLVAFSTAPGAVAADGSGANSPFTAALVRHLPTPGLELRGALTRVRAEVAQATNSAQVPWSNDGLLDELFLAGRAAPAAPTAPSQQLALAPQAAAPSQAAMELTFWQSIQASGSAADFEAYLRQFPNGTFAGLARNRLEALRATLPAAPASIPIVPPSQAVPPAASQSGYPVPVGESFRDCAECPEMVVIPAGRFVMGSPASEAGRDDDEGPQREVVVSRPLAVGKFEVTFGEWDACLAGGGCTEQPNDQGWGRGRQPVMNVSWFAVQQYLEWLSRRTGRVYRLLTEAEWEYAARTGTVTPYSFGASVRAAQANFSNHAGRTRPVGSYAPNRWGLHDMHGNVWEWVEDCWASSYWRDPFSGEPISAGHPWIAGGAPCERVLRGGSWISPARSLRAASRYPMAPGTRDAGFGFRVARAR